jgi:hypothetical protein
VARIFISYRRNDDPYIAGRIRDHLTHHFGPESLFFDVDDIPPGRDFREVIHQALSKSQFLVAIIGPEWVHATDDEGQRRLDIASDFVRIELETALELGIPVIPALIKSAKMPKPTQLPESLEDLAYKNAVHIRPDPDFKQDMQRLIRSLAANATPPNKKPPLPKSSRRKARSATRPDSPPPALDSPQPDSTRPAADSQVKWWADSPKLKVLFSRRSAQAVSHDPDDEFMSPLPGIILGTTTEKEFRAYAKSNDMEISSEHRFEDSIYTGYHYHVSAVPHYFKINLKSFTLETLTQRLVALRYQTQTSDPEPLPYREAFWDQGDQLTVNGNRTLDDGRMLTVKATFFDSAILKLHASSLHKLGSYRNLVAIEARILPAKMEWSFPPARDWQLR